MENQATQNFMWYTTKQNKNIIIIVHSFVEKIVQK